VHLKGVNELSKKYEEAYEAELAKPLPKSIDDIPVKRPKTM